jgi:hypothetical protein
MSGDHRHRVIRTDLATTSVSVGATGPLSKNSVSDQLGQALKCRELRKKQ